MKARARRRLTAKRRKFQKLRQAVGAPDYADFLDAFGTIPRGSYPWWRLRQGARDRGKIIDAWQERHSH